MQIDPIQFAEMMNKISSLELFGAIAVLAICITLFIVGYLERFRK